MSTATELRL